MLNQVFTAADIAADHRRTLHAEAEAYRLARQATDAADPAARPQTRLVAGIVKKIIGLSPAPRTGESPNSSRKALRAS
jgi:hypothetical protein